MSRHTGGQKKRVPAKSSCVNCYSGCSWYVHCASRSIYNDDKSHSLKLFPSSLTLPSLSFCLAFKFFKKVSRFEIKSISARKRDGNGKLALLLFPFFFFCCRSLQRDRTHFSPLPLSCVHRLEAKRKGPIHRLYFFNLFSPSHKSQSASSEITYCVVHWHRTCKLR